MYYATLHYVEGLEELENLFTAFESYCKDIIILQESSIVYVSGVFWKTILPKHYLSLLLSQGGCVVFCIVYMD